jgi:CRISPR-associated protein Cmr1
MPDITCTRKYLKDMGDKAGMYLYLGAICLDALAAWSSAVKIYRRFRQDDFRGEKHAKQLGNRKMVSVPGRNRWPEPDSIRKITGCALRGQSDGSDPDVDTHDHSIPLVPMELLPLFPRAVLGLPINFHFADAPAGKNPSPREDRDPVDSQILPLLDGEVGSRMASPVITKAVRVDGQWRPLVAILPSAGKALGIDCVLKARGPGEHEVRERIPNARVRGEGIRAIRPCGGRENALVALTNFVERNDFEEVK